MIVPNKITNNAIFYPTQAKWHNGRYLFSLVNVSFSFFPQLLDASPPVDRYHSWKIIVMHMNWLLVTERCLLMHHVTVRAWDCGWCDRQVYLQSECESILSCSCIVNQVNIWYQLPRMLNESLYCRNKDDKEESGYKRTNLYRARWRAGHKVKSKSNH